MVLLKNCRYVVTQDAARAILENVDIKIADGMITEIGTGLSDSEEIDCSEKIVMPGLVNAHCHLAMTGLRGIAHDSQLHGWLATVMEREAAMDDGERERMSVLGCRESLRFGTTAIADQYTPMVPTAKAVAASGMRGVLFTGFHSIDANRKALLSGKRQHHEIRGDLFSDSVFASPLLTTGLGIHSPYTATAEYLEAGKKYALGSGKRFMMHIGETRKEQADCKKAHGLLPIEFLERHGLLDWKTLLVHVVWITKREIALIAAKGASVVHCPASNMRLASGGVMPLKEMLAAGVKVALGTDGAASNDNLDMFEEMKLCALLHKQHYWDPTMADAQTVLDMATLNGAKALGMEQEIGSIEAGKKADIITLAISDHLQPIDKERVVSHLVYAANGNDVADVLVDGKVRVREKEFV